MHSNNYKKEEGIRWIPTERFERIGPDKYQKETPQSEMSKPNNNFVTELVNAFNLHNYYSEYVYTNFAVKGNKIVGLFTSDVEVKKYFQELKKEIIKKHYGTELKAGDYYNLDFFPFAFNVNSKWKAKGRAIREVELADSTNNEVIRNLKIYFAKEFQYIVEEKVVESLVIKMTEDTAWALLQGSVLEEMDRSSPYLYCISFNDGYCKENDYPPRLFEVVRCLYICEFKSKLEEYGCNDSSIFYERRHYKLYIKDFTNIDVIKNVVKRVREEIAFDFKTPGTEYSKVKNLKDVFGDLIFKKVGKPIKAFDYGVFIDEEQRKKGHRFALIPLEERKDDEFYTLGLTDAMKIDPSVLYQFEDSYISEVSGKIANPQFANCKESVYAFSNKQIARLLPIMMESPIEYNEKSGHFEFAVDLENFKRLGLSPLTETLRRVARLRETSTKPSAAYEAVSRHFELVADIENFMRSRSSQSSSTVTSPTHAGPSGLRTPPEERQEDS